MAESEFLQKFFAGNPPKAVRLLAARGMIPIAPDDMLPLLVRLTSDDEPEVSAKAAETLKGLDESAILLQLQSPGCNSSVLDFFAESASDQVQEAVLLSPNAGASAVSKLARKVGAPLLEIILYNRTRLLDAPEILEGVKQNPAATPQILSLVAEIETEFFGEKKQEYTVTEAGVEEEAAGDQIVQAESELPPEDLELEGLPLDPKERDAAIQNRINAMTVRQKIQLALMGTREARAVLIRDPNKEVSTSVLQSPKLTANEVESFAAMRNTSEQVLRLIATNKKWLRSYAVIHNLVRNPKTPAGLAQRLLPRIFGRDLLLLAHDRGIPETVRRIAERMAKERHSAR